MKSVPVIHVIKTLLRLNGPRRDSFFQILVSPGPSITAKARNTPDSANVQLITPHLNSMMSIAYTQEVPISGPLAVCSSGSAHTTNISPKTLQHPVPERSHGEIFFATVTGHLT